MKQQIQNFLLDEVRRRSEREARRLAGEFARAASEEKEAILAELEIEQWLAESCRDCLSQ